MNLSFTWEWDNMGPGGSLQWKLNVGIPQQICCKKPYSLSNTMREIMQELQNHSFPHFEAIYHQGIPQREQSLQHDEPLDHPYLDRKEARSGASVESGS